MGITERRIRQKEEVRVSILTAAWKMVEEEGWQALSIRRIAEAIEYSVPVIYDHFENKEAILLEFTRRGFQLLNEEIATAKSPDPNPEKQIEAIARAYWKFAFSNKEFYHLMYGMGMPGCESVQQIPELKAFSMQLREPLELLAEKSKRKIDAHLKLRTLWSGLHGFVSISKMDKSGQIDEKMNQQILDDFIQMFIAGMK